MSRKLEFIVLVILLIFVAQFIYISSTTNALCGADDKPVGVIEQITGGTYKPIAKPIWEPPSAEIENLLFALQAAIGAGVIGYFLGYYRAKSRFEGEFGVQSDEKSESTKQS